MSMRIRIRIQSFDDQILEKIYSWNKKNLFSDQKLDVDRIHNTDSFLKIVLWIRIYFRPY